MTFLLKKKIIYLIENIVFLLISPGNLIKNVLRLYSK